MAKIPFQREFDDLFASDKAGRKNNLYNRYE
jgi:hypothetical protein